MVRLKLKIGTHSEVFEFGVSALGRVDIYLGHDWLKHHNPVINWKTGSLLMNNCPPECEQEGKNDSTIDIDGDHERGSGRWHEWEEGDKMLAVVREEREESWGLRAYATTATEIAVANQVKRDMGKIIPAHYLSHREVFEKETFDELPKRGPWDHAIELVPGAKAVDCKIYPLNKEEQEQLDAFLKENLDTGRIRTSKSPMASPFFFIKKKDGKLRPVQDYRKLNEMTIKN